MRRTPAAAAVLTLAFLLPGPASPASAEGPLDPSLSEQIHDYVIGVLDDLNVPGASVVIVDVDGPVFAEGFGTAVDSGRPATPQTPFRIASISKQLTGIAAMQLVQAGDLSLSATVRDYLPWFGAEGSPTARITVRDLLAHTTGWGERDGSLAVTGTDADDGAMERNARRLADTPLTYPIGEFHYINGSYDVLGYLIGEVSGTSFEVYLQEHVLDPLQMSNTHLSQASARAGGVALGHLPFFGIQIGYEIPYSRASMPSASVAASAEDLGHVLIAHLNGGAYEGQTILSPDAVAELHEPLVETFPGHGYGWGWWSYPFYDAGSRTEGGAPRYEAPIVLEHGGSLATFASEMVLMPEAGYGIVMLMNANDEVAPSRFYQAHLGIANLLLGNPAAGLTSYDEPVRAFGRPIAAGVPLLQLVGIGIALRRLRRWRRNPPAGAGSSRWRLRHLGLPLVVDLGVPMVLWGLFFTTSQLAPVDFLRVLPYSPDVGLALLVVAVLGLGWGLVRTALTLRVVRGSTT
jgi:CubicO group peptidase (beta-lactamase class C family)